MSTHAWRVRKRAERANQLPWTRMCLEAGFSLDEVKHVTIRDLHERVHGPVGGESLLDIWERSPMNERKSA